jgi:hypothetical protein
MMKKELREKKLSEICQRISKLTYKELQNEFSVEFEEKISTEREHSIDLTIGSRIEKYNNPKTIDDIGKSTLKYIVEIFKSKTLKFQKSDLEKIQFFTTKINTLLQGTNFSGAGIDNRISLIKDGPNSDVKGHSIDLVNLFNDFKVYDKFSELTQNGSLDKAFIDDKTFLSHIRYLYSICKSCENINKYPLNYKQWQLLGKWFFEIPRHDYDSFCEHYNNLNNLGEPKLLNFSSYYYLLGLKLKSDEEYKRMISESEKEKEIIEKLIWVDRFPNTTLTEELESKEQISSIEIRFKEWLKINMPKSADKYFSYFNTANKISQINELGNLFLWSKLDWSDLESRLLEVPDFINKNSSGHNSLTASIGQYKKFMSMKNIDILAPIIKYPEYRWYWASSQPVLEFNRLDIICGVTKIIGEIGGKAVYNEDFKSKLTDLENRLNLTPKQLSKSATDNSKNVIASAREYWQGTGLINTDNSLTVLGTLVSNEEISEEQLSIEFIQNIKLPNTNLPNRYTPEVVLKWEEFDLQITPLKLIIDILIELFYRFDNGTESYLSVDELVNIVIPISADTPNDINKYCNAIIDNRNEVLDISTWPKYSSGGNEDKRLPKEFLVALNYWGFLEQVEIKGKEDVRYYLTNKARNLFSNSRVIQKSTQKLLTPTSSKFEIEEFVKSTSKAGLIFSPELVRRFIASLCTKPFVICSGLSGSGKTKLAQAFAQWISYKEEDGENNEQYCIVPVGADWTTREPLLGYPNALMNTEYVSPENGVLDLMIRAKQNFENEEESTKPYFLILDEMNLSHVERYFADFLSTMESGDIIPLHKIFPEPTKELITIPQALKLPKNLFIIGTVNIDETTYMFSPKVLDRANTIEFRLTEKDLEEFIDSDLELNMDLLNAQGLNMSDSFMAMALRKTDKNLKPTETDLKLFFSELKKSGAEFGYRTASEIGRLMYMLKEVGEEGNNLLDIAIMQKLLPKLHGSRNKLTKILPILGGFCLKDNSKIKENYFDKFLSNSLTEVEIKLDDNIKFKISFEKICRMNKNAVENGFASYAEA